MSLKDRMTGQQVAVPLTRKSLEGMREEFQKALPRGAEAERLIRDAVTCLRQNEQLWHCTRESFLGALMNMAQLGLRPGVLGHGWLIPMWTNGKMVAQLIIGYQGLVDLAQRSGMIESISARIVHENDEFDVEYGTSDRLIHRPCLKGDRGSEIGAYAVVKANGGIYWEHMSKSDLERHRDDFAMAKKRDGSIVGPWRDHFWAMGLKTVLKRALKYAPRSTELMNAMAADETIRTDLNRDAEISTVAQYVAPDSVSVVEVTDIPEGIDQPQPQQYQQEEPPGMDPWAQDGGNR